MTTTYDPRILARHFINQWHTLIERADAGTFNREDALNLVTCVIELGKLGYTLTADESDWQPPQQSVTTPAIEPLYYACYNPHSHQWAVAGVARDPHGRNFSISVGTFPVRLITEAEADQVRQTGKLPTGEEV